MYYYNNIPTYQNNMYDVKPTCCSNPQTSKDERLIGGGGFLLPFALGFASSPLILGPPRPPYYGPPRPPYYGPYPYPYPYR